MVPEGWTYSTLEGLIDIKHGFAFKSEHFTNQGQFVLLTPGHFNESGGFRDRQEKTKYYSGIIPEGYLLTQGDLLLAMTEQAAGLLGSAAHIPENNKYLHNQRLGLVKVLNPSKIYLRFLFWLYNSPEVRKQIAEQASGTKVKHTSPSRLIGVTALLPPKQEQIKMAQILSTWDKAIATTERLLANSQQQKQALMQQLLTGQKRFKQFADTWKTYRLGDLFERVTKKNTENNTNVVSISAQQGLIRQDEFFKKSVASETLEGYYLLSHGQFAYNKSYSNGYPMGAIKRLNRYEKGVVTTLYICFAVRDESNFCPVFFEQFFDAGLLNEGLAQVAHEGGRAHGLLNVKPSDFFSLKVKIPSLKEQQKIAQVLSTADAEITNLQAQLAKLKLEKKALMQQLLTGQRRVKPDAEVTV